MGNCFQGDQFSQLQSQMSALMAMLQKPENFEQNLQKSKDLSAQIKVSIAECMKHVEGISHCLDVVNKDQYQDYQPPSPEQPLPSLKKIKKEAEKKNIKDVQVYLNRIEQNQQNLDELKKTFESYTDSVVHKNLSLVESLFAHENSRGLGLANTFVKA